MRGLHYNDQFAPFVACALAADLEEEPSYE